MFELGGFDWADRGNLRRISCDFSIGYDDFIQAGWSFLIKRQVKLFHELFLKEDGLGPLCIEDSNEPVNDQLV
jgi:hypothetical protein